VGLRAIETSELLHTAMGPTKSGIYVRSFVMCGHELGETNPPVERSIPSIGVRLARCMSRLCDTKSISKSGWEKHMVSAW
jgi:hypothetical protein